MALTPKDQVHFVVYAEKNGDVIEWTIDDSSVIARFIDGDVYDTDNCVWRDSSEAENLELRNDLFTRLYGVPPLK